MTEIRFEICGSEWIVSLYGNGNGNISSDARELCENCGGIFMHHDDCNESSEDEQSRFNYNISIDALESIVLAHACAGIHILDEKYQTGLATAIDNCAQNF